MEHEGVQHTASTTQAAPQPTTHDMAGNLAAIAIANRIPEFWKMNPKLWFIQFEAVVAPQRPSDDQRWQAVIAKLQLPDLQQVSDLLTSPPIHNKYEALKARLIATNQDSELRQFQKLLSEMELGDQKPSQLLRRMRDLAGTKVSDEALKFLWAGHLPTAVRTVLAVSDRHKLEDLAVIADSVLESARSSTQLQEIAQVSHPATPQAMQATISELTLKISEMCTTVSQMSAELAAIREVKHRSTQHSYDQTPRRNRSYSRESYDRQRNYSRNRPQPGEPTHECYYHDRFGNNARKCSHGCKHFKPSEN